MHGDRHGVEQFAVTAAAALNPEPIALAGEVGYHFEADASHAPAVPQAVAVGNGRPEQSGNRSVDCGRFDRSQDWPFPSSKWAGWWANAAPFSQASVMPKLSRRVRRTGHSTYPSSRFETSRSGEASFSPARLCRRPSVKIKLAHSSYAGGSDRVQVGAFSQLMAKPAVRHVRI